MKLYLLKIRDMYADMKVRQQSKWILIAAIAGCLFPVFYIKFMGEVLFLIWLIGWALYTVQSLPQQEQCDRNRMLKQLITSNLYLYLDTPSWDFAAEPNDTQLELLEQGNPILLYLDDTDFDQAEIQMHKDYTFEIKIHNTTKEWYDESGHDAIEELVYDAASQGKQELLLTPELLYGLPKPERWTQLANFLNNDGIIAFIQDDGLRLLTEGGD